MNLVWSDTKDKSVTEIHKMAMEAYDIYEQFKKRGNDAFEWLENIGCKIADGLNGEADARRYYIAESLRLEMAAAYMLLDKFDVEPTRSVLFRSAATIALELGLYRDAEILCCQGLRSSLAPKNISSEIRDILLEIYTNVGKDL